MAQSSTQDMSGDVIFELDGEVFARIAKSEIMANNRGMARRIRASVAG